MNHIITYNVHFSARLTLKQVHKEDIQTSSFDTHSFEAIIYPNHTRCRQISGKPDPLPLLFLCLPVHQAISNAWHARPLFDVSADKS